jgi:hypothetical protein
LHNIKINLKEAGNESDQSIIQAQGRKSCHVFVTREIKRRVTFKEWEFLQLLREKKLVHAFRQIVVTRVPAQIQDKENPKSSLPYTAKK